MKRIKKPVVREEITTIEITADEFAEIAAQECAEMLKSAPHEDMHFAVLLSLSFAEFSANLMHRLFDETDEEEAEG